MTRVNVILPHNSLIARFIFKSVQEISINFEFEMEGQAFWH